MVATLRSRGINARIAAFPATVGRRRSGMSLSRLSIAHALLGRYTMVWWRGWCAIFAGAAVLSVCGVASPSASRPNRRIVAAVVVVVRRNRNRNRRGVFDGKSGAAALRDENSSGCATSTIAARGVWFFGWFERARYGSSSSNGSRRQTTVTPHDVHRGRRTGCARYRSGGARHCVSDAGVAVCAAALLCNIKVILEPSLATR
jgi:hypothetical protein